MIELWIWYLFAGLLAGILSALFGIGSGVILVPLLAMAFGYAQKSAQGMALMIMIPMVMVGALRYKLNPDVEVNLAVCAWMAVGGVLGALAGSYLAFILNPVLLKRLFAIFVLVVGVRMLWSTFAVPQKSNEPVELSQSAGGEKV